MTVIFLKTEVNCVSDIKSEVPEKEFKHKHIKIQTDTVTVLPGFHNAHFRGNCVCYSGLLVLLWNPFCLGISPMLA